MRNLTRVAEPRPRHQNALRCHEGGDRYRGARVRRPHRRRRPSLGVAHPGGPGGTAHRDRRAQRLPRPRRRHGHQPLPHPRRRHRRGRRGAREGGHPRPRDAGRRSAAPSSAPSSWPRAATRGVIVSQLVGGICDTVIERDVTEADAVLVADALARGAASARASVAHPQEGTILTVADAGAAAAVQARRGGRDARRRRARPPSTPPRRRSPAPPTSSRRCAAPGSSTPGAPGASCSSSPSSPSSPTAGRSPTPTSSAVDPACCAATSGTTRAATGRSRPSPATTRSTARASGSATVPPTR